MMNLLLTKASDEITVRGLNYKIKTDFEVWARFVVAIQKKDETQLLNEYANIFTEKLPVPNEEAFAEIFKWLYGESEKTNDTTKHDTPALDFEYDGNVIYVELWRYFPELMKRGITYHEAMECIQNLMQDENTELYHRVFARKGDFSKLSKEQRRYWLKERGRLTIKNRQTEADIDAIFSNGMR